MIKVNDYAVAKCRVISHLHDVSSDLSLGSLALLKKSVARMLNLLIQHDDQGDIVPVLSALEEQVRIWEERGEVSEEAAKTFFGMVCATDRSKDRERYIRVI